MDIRRPTKEPAQRGGRELATTNGKQPHDVRTEVAVVPVDVGGGGPPPAGDADLRLVLDALRADVRALRRQVDELHRPADTAEQLGEATARALSLVESLPPRIARAAGEAMRQQHQINLRDLREQWTKFAAEADRIKEAQAREAAAGRRAADVQAAARVVRETAARDVAAPDPAVIMRELDARFQWLVNEISERFVVLGNEMVRIEQHLAAGGYRAAATNGQSAHGATARTD